MDHELSFPNTESFILLKTDKNKVINRKSFNCGNAIVGDIRRTYLVDCHKRIFFAKSNPKEENQKICQLVYLDIFEESDSDSMVVLFEESSQIEKLILSLSLKG
jgi:hypothetical protein